MGILTTNNLCSIRARRRLWPLRHTNSAVSKGMQAENVCSGLKLVGSISPFLSHVPYCDFVCGCWQLHFHCVCSVCSISHGHLEGLFEYCFRWPKVSNFKVWIISIQKKYEKVGFVPKGLMLHHSHGEFLGDSLLAPRRTISFCVAVSRPKMVTFFCRLHGAF